MAPDVPALTPSEVLGQWSVEPWLLVPSLAVAGGYLAAVVLLHRRGDRWPVGRAASFLVLGLGSFWFATSSGLAAYDTTLLSAHMVQHMILSMVVPLFLALGAPVTLAARTLPTRPRRWLLAVLHSPVARVLTFPPLAFGLFVLSPWALYFTGWYDATLRSAYLHEAMHVHLVLVGSLFFWPLVGTDPVPGRVGYPFRMLLILMTLPFHAFLGVTIMGQSTLIAEDWYGGLRAGPMGSWLPSVAEDQHLAGGILWGSGDLVGLLMFGVLFAQWVRSSVREAAREDRRLDLLEARAARAARAAADPSAHDGDR